MASRVNTKFIIILSSVLVSLVLGLVGLRVVCQNANRPRS